MIQPLRYTREISELIKEWQRNGIGYRCGNRSRYVQGFKVCQQQTFLTTYPEGLLQLLPILALIWYNVSMDFIKRLPQS